METWKSALPPRRGAIVKDRIRRFILGESEDLVHGLDFGAVALSLYRWQRAQNSDYDEICGSASPSSWEEIPAVPVALFRDLELCCFDPAQAQIHFRTSGTTGRRGSHRLLDTDLYDLGARRHAESVIGALPTAGISLVSHAPDSSLGHMCENFVPGMKKFFDPVQGTRRGPALEAIRACTEAVFIPMTGLAAAELLEQPIDPVMLPPGSVLMVTGGFKGRTISVDAQTLEGCLRQAFPGTKLVGEYGMTELGSQLWSPDLGEPFVPPPWMRVLAVDPWTGEPAEEGILRFFDLCNHQSVLAIETSDLGRVLEDGRVELLGRLSGSRLRGCSLTVEEARLSQLLEEESLIPPEEEHIHDETCAHEHVEAVSEAVEISSEDSERIDRVLTALGTLRRVDPKTMGDGLSRSQVMGSLGMAIGAITREGLASELALHSRRPSDVSLVIARGVFTAPIEWVALYAAAGIQVEIKAPAGGDSMCEALASAFQAQDLAVSCHSSRELGSPSAIVAFGSDESIEQIAAEWPETPKALFGHRFSIALASPVHAQVLAWEVAHYDTRGCMAPAGVFCLEDPTPHLDALCRAMAAAQRAMPRGEIESAQGPEWRRRIGLARVEGEVREGEGWAIVQLPASHFVPTALPRMMSLYTLSGPEELYRLLGPWREQLSTLGADDLLRPWRSPLWEEIYSWFPRKVSLGLMQRPSLPRLHDGVAMLGSICSGD
jgi:hypothetical protein